MSRKTQNCEKEKNRGFIWGFPVGDSEASEACDSPGGKKKEKGISLLIAIMAIAVMITFIAEMIVSSTVNVEMTLLGRDRAKADYLARSGLNLGLYFLTANRLWDQVQASGVMGQKVEPTDGPGSLWNIINTLPPMGSDSLGMMKLAADAEGDPLGLSGFMNEKVAGQMELLEGQFTVKVSDEQSRINLNDCSSGGARACQEVLAQLEALFSCPAEKAFLETKNLSPKEMAYRIKDFIIDFDRESVESNIDSKDGPYEKENPPYKSKRAPFDSLEELRLVKGWDDDMHAVFSPYLTIYPFKYKKEDNFAVNINTAPKELLSCLIPQSWEESVREKSVQELYRLQKKESNLAGDKKAIKEKLKSLFGYTGEGDNDETKLENWFTVRSDVFRLEVTAQTGHQERKLIAVIRRLDSGNQEPLVLKREIKRAWQVLYWKLI